MNGSYGNLNVPVSTNRVAEHLDLASALARALGIRFQVAGQGDARMAPGGPAYACETQVLTPREREVAVLIARGLTNRQIGEALVITEGTANLHVKHILRKLGFSTRAQIAAWTTRLDLALSLAHAVEDGRVGV